MNKIIVIANQKGGVGKTTTTINLCTFLSYYKKKVLLIDMDPQANATSGIGLDIQENIGNNIYHTLIGKKNIEDVITTVNKNNKATIDVIPSHPELSGAEIELVSMMAREYRLKNSLNDLKNEYDFIFIDTPPSLNLLTINALAAANSIIIPLQTEYYAMEGLSALMNTIKLINDNLNPNLSIEGILLTMFDQRTKISHLVAEEVTKYFNWLVFETVIPRNVKLVEAPSFGQSILEYDFKSTGAKSYNSLELELIAKNKKAATV